MTESRGLRLVFAGTPEFAAQHLQALLESDHQVVGVYSQPDRPSGRGKKLNMSPVKALALAYQIPVFQPLSLKDAQAQSELAALNADLMIVVAYGLILPKVVLMIPRLGCVNVHASLLPRWRGAAPIQRAIEAGDSETGITIMQMDVGLDTGDILAKAVCPITSTDTSGALHDRLISIGVPVLLETLKQIQHHTAGRIKQEDALSTYAPKLSKEEAALDWSCAAIELERKVRAFNPFPIAHTKLFGAPEEARIRVWAAKANPETTDEPVGSVISITKTGVEVACKSGQLVLQQLQLPGKKPMGIDEILRGHPDLFKVGDRLDQPC